MDAQEFIFWLRGVVDFNDELTPKQVDKIRHQLKSVDTESIPNISVPTPFSVPRHDLTNPNPWRGPDVYCTNDKTTDNTASAYDEYDSNGNHKITGCHIIGGGYLNSDLSGTNRTIVGGCSSISGDVPTFIGVDYNSPVTGGCNSHPNNDGRSIVHDPPIGAGCSSTIGNVFQENPSLGDVGAIGIAGTNGPDDSGLYGKLKGSNGNPIVSG